MYLWHVLPRYLGKPFLHLRITLELRIPSARVGRRNTLLVRTIKTPLNSCGTPQHRLSSQKMALITSDCGIMCSLSIKWPYSP